MDALNIHEQAPERSHASVRTGKSHACGHDGHMSMVLGAAKLLCERRDFNGTVRFIFQPAEEHGKGAKAMIADKLFERFPSMKSTVFTTFQACEPEPLQRGPVASWRVRITSLSVSMDVAATRRDRI